MIVGPYKRPPLPPLVAVLAEDGSLLHEDGASYDPESLPQGTRCFGQWDMVRLLMREGRGEALCWNNEEVRWRSQAHPNEDEWKSRPGDVYALRLPLSEVLTPRVFLSGVTAWRDWLDRWGASPTGTTGSTAMALLRARLRRRIACGCGERPPLVQTRGGRMQLGPGGQGRYSGSLVQLDLPAAYAAQLGSVSYGGIWQPLDKSGGHLGFWLDSSEAPLFVQAEVSVPRLQFGPLMRCFGRRVHFAQMAVYGRAVYKDGSPWLYPSGRRLTGVWTRNEVRAAIEVGCKLKVRGAWVHRSPWTPFAPWWEAVEDGRSSLGRTGESLAKMTGNALWGRFCLDPELAGKRTIVGAQKGSRSLRERPAPPPAHDLAEYVSGSVRGRLFELMSWAGERLLVANTDGAWIRDDGSPFPEGWRVKLRAHRLDVLAPTCLRYWPTKSRWPLVVFAGVPAIEAEEMFEQEWRRSQGVL